MESKVMPPDHASARQTEMGGVFNRVLFSAIDAMEDNQIPYGLIGGIAASGMGRPRSTHDIDIFVRPEDADAALAALAKNGFETEIFDKRWLYKGWKDDMMVDIIFKSSGDIYFDNEMQAHTKRILYHGREIATVSPEDLIVIKAAVHSEIGPHHWHDALALLSHAPIDYAYLVKRARKAARKVLALMIYAQGNDILVPSSAVFELAHTIFGDAIRAPIPKFQESPMARPHMGTGLPANNPAPAPKTNGEGNQDAYLLAHLNESLATDPRTATTTVQLNLCDQGRTLSVKGEVQTEKQRKAIEEVLKLGCDNVAIENKVRVTQLAPPEVEEVL